MVVNKTVTLNRIVVCNNSNYQSSRDISNNRRGQKEYSIDNMAGITGVKVMTEQKVKEKGKIIRTIFQITIFVMYVLVLVVLF